LINHYDILGLTINASQDDIKTAYRKLSIKFHPDKNNGDKFFEEMFKKINDANEILSNTIRRRQYDILLKDFEKEKRTANNDILRKEADWLKKQEELNRKEEEWRKKQEELDRKEKVLKDQEAHQMFIHVKPVSLIVDKKFVNWRIIGVLVIGIIFVFAVLYFLNKDDVNNADIDNSELQKKIKINNIVTKAIVKLKIDHSKQIMGRESDSLVKKLPNQSKDFNIMAKPVEVNLSSDSSIDTTKKINIKNIQDSIKKPKWYQFKKRKQWKEIH
jgi:curved DNA-binding protein CbpA